MLRLIKAISDTVKLANQIAAESGGRPKWSLFLTNRSFIAQVFALVFACLGLFGVPLHIPADIAANAVYGVAFAVMQVWALAERLMGRTTVVWSLDGAVDAVHREDALSKALREAGAK